jgi:hypothetical protein
MDWVHDCEVYPNYFGLGFANPDGAVVQFSTLRANLVALDDWIADRVADGDTVYGFNSDSYDDHILAAVLAENWDCASMYALSQSRIGASERFSRSPLRGIVPIIDLRGVLGGDAVAGLKELGIKLDHPLLRELPYRYDTDLTPEQQREVEAYNLNDLVVTLRLLDAMRDALSARRALAAKHGVDVLGRKDSGLAEAILRAEMFGDEKPTWSTRKAWRATGREIINPDIEFSDPPLKAALDVMRDWRLSAEIVRGEDDERKLEVEKPAGLEVQHGGNTYTLGLGGLHTRDTPAIFRADDDYEIVDIDVESYYPNLIRSMFLCPDHLDRESFLLALSDTIDERVEAKRDGDKALNLGLKIAINSVFGKFSSPYSWLCDPRVSWTVTINGQLILLMACELIGEVAEVLSANTDGALVRVRKDRRDDLAAVIEAIEAIFHIRFSYTPYSVFARRDINNYMAVGTDGVVKGKGAYAHDQSNLLKKATERVVIDAVQAYFVLGTPVRDTISACQDIRAFVDYFKAGRAYTIRSGDDEVGGIARWVHTLSGTPLSKVKLADGSRTILAGGKPVTVLSDLPEGMLPDINIDHYCQAAQDLVDSIENPKIEAGTTLAIADMSKEQLVVFRHNHAVRVADPETVRAVDLTTVRALYGEAGRSQYDVMKRLMVRLWLAERGRITCGDLIALARLIDEGTDYFVPPAKARSLASMAEWVSRTISPFPRTLGLLEIAEGAIRWAHIKVEVVAKPRTLTRGKLVNTTSLKGWWRHQDSSRLAASIASLAVKNAYPIQVDELALILGQIIESRRDVTPEAQPEAQPEAPVGEAHRAPLLIVPTLPRKLISLQPLVDIASITGGRIAAKTKHYPNNIIERRNI